MEELKRHWAWCVRKEKKLDWRSYSPVRLFADCASYSLLILRILFFLFFVFFVSFVPFVSSYSSDSLYPHFSQNVQTGREKHENVEETHLSQRLTSTNARREETHRTRSAGVGRVGRTLLSATRAAVRRRWCWFLTDASVGHPIRSSSPLVLALAGLAEER